MQFDSHHNNCLPIRSLSMRVLASVGLGLTLVICMHAHSVETAAQEATKPVVPPVPRRLPDGHPNWTGFWVPEHGLLEVNIGLGGTPEGAASLLRRPTVEHAALKSPFKEQFDKTVADAQRGIRPDRTALCFPPGMPGMMSMVYGMEVLQTHDVIAITSEWQAASRRIWMNRRTHPSNDELDLSFAGDSVGRWRGDTLEVDTVGLREDVPLNPDGLPHSKNMHIKELFREKKPGILIDTITIEDPDAFIASWSYQETYRFRPDLEIREYVCLENNRNIDPSGVNSFK